MPNPSGRRRGRGRGRGRGGGVGGSTGGVGGSSGSVGVSSGSVGGSSGSVGGSSGSVGGSTAPASDVRGGVRARPRVAPRVGLAGARPSLSGSLALGDTSLLPVVPQGEAPLCVRRRRILPRFVDFEESSGVSTPQSSTHSRKRAQPPEPSASLGPGAKRRLPYDDVDVLFGGPGTSAEPTEQEAVPGPSWWEPSTAQRVQQPPRPLRTENLRPDDIEANLDMEDFDSDEELPGDDLAELAFVEEPVFRHCEDVETPEAAASRPELAFQEWPPRSRPAAPAPAPPAEEPQPATSTFEASATVYGPIDKFEFEWKAFPNPQVQTEPRKENFSDSNVGPTCSYETPYDAFTAIWDQGIMEHIATETNRYAQQVTERLFATGSLKPDSRITRWKDTSASELYTFFAIILAMGIVVKSVAQDYWQKAMNIFSTPGFAPIMSYNRFHLLCQCLHFNNNRNCDRRSLSNSEMKFFKVKPIVHHLNNKFANLYKLSKNVSLHESLTMWKGWLNINQFIRNKASAIGIKTYELCESQTGYTWRFKVHTGQDHSCSENAAPVSGAIPSLVLDILKGLEGKGHTIWMDNYYNSPALARELKSLGFDCVGTLRTNRQFVPGEMTNLKKESMTVGHVYGCTSGDVDLLLWRDKNRVALISTYHGNTVTVRDNKHIPSAVADYNVCMGGVDRKDALLSHYPIERKRTLGWYTKLFRRLLNVSTLNAFILYNASHTTSHRSFRETLVKELLARHGPTIPPPPPPKPLITGHFPSQYPLMSGSEGARGVHNRRRCAHCKKRTTFYCIACNVALCVPGESCFIDYHNRL